MRTYFGLAIVWLCSCGETDIEGLDPSLADAAMPDAAACAPTACVRVCAVSAEAVRACGADLRACAGDPPMPGTRCADEWTATGACLGDIFARKAQCMRVQETCERFFADEVECQSVCIRDFYICQGSGRDSSECEAAYTSCKIDCVPPPLCDRPDAG